MQAYLQLIAAHQKLELLGDEPLETPLKAPRRSPELQQRAFRCVFVEKLIETRDARAQRLWRLGEFIGTSMGLTWGSRFLVWERPGRVRL